MSGFALGTLLGQAGRPAPRAKPHGGRFVLSGGHGNGGKRCCSPAHSHLRPPPSWAPLASDTKTNLGPRPSITACGLTGSKGWGHPRRPWNTWWQNPGPPTCPPTFPKKGRRRGRKNQRGRGWTSVSSRAGGNPDPSPRQILLGLSLNRKGKLPSGMGWAGMWALRLGVWKPI